MTLDTRLLEDLAALATAGSLARAAAARHVTHPAFGRRIRQLEAWAGAALVEHGRSPLRLTPAGQELLEQTQPLLATLQQTRARLKARSAPAAGTPALRVGTGRTLARTLVADWLARLRAPLKGVRVEVVTRSMAEVAALFEQGEVDLLCCYEHPALSIRLSAQRFVHLTLAHDKLVPVTQADAHGAPRHTLAHGRLIDYASTLTLGRLTRDHLERAGHGGTPALVADSADAIAAFVERGLGFAWLPWSLVAPACRRGTLVAIGGRAEQIPFDVRLYRPKARLAEGLEAVWAITAR
jgi:LysR family transcriptional regulator, hypochlorite-specific transcription factor HypT